MATDFVNYETGDVISSEDLNAVRTAINSIEDALGDLLEGSLAVGDLLVISSSGTIERLPIGSEGQTLTVVSGVPGWA